MLLLFAEAGGQVAGENTTSKKTGTAGAGAAAAVARWRYMLDDLAHEARTLSEAAKRPLALAEVADIYWEIDRDRSRELFTSALETTLSLPAGGDEATRSLRRVIALAAGRDASLARALTEMMLRSASEKDWAASESLSVAGDLLDADTRRAAQLAEAAAAGGPSLNSAWFILQLSKRDPAAAEQVYRAYLNGFTPNSGLGLNQLLWLAGYPFGYAEAFGGGPDPARMAGLSGLRVSGLSPKPALAQAFLNVAFRAAKESLDRAGTADPQQREALSVPALFATVYLLPEVRRYRPQALSAWSNLRQQALSGTTVVQREAVDRRVREIVSSRPRPGESEGAEPYESVQAEDILGRAEKLPSGCGRDAEFARAALTIGYRKDFPRALEVAGRIGDESMRDGVRRFLYYDMSVAAAARGDVPSLEDAQKYAESVTAPEQRALLNVKIAGASLRNKDPQTAARLLRETVRLAEAVPDTASQAGILLAAAAGFADFDGYEGSKALKEAVKIVNSSRTPRDVDDFRVLRKVNLSCFAGKESWYGGSERPERFSIYETFAAMAAADLEGMLSLARDLDDPSIRLRSLASVVRAALKSPRGVSPASGL